MFYVKYILYIMYSFTEKGVLKFTYKKANNNHARDHGQTRYY